MDEKELAAQLQAAKFDSDEWGDDIPEPSEGLRTGLGKAPAPKRRLAAMVSVRLSPEELEAVQEQALQRGETVSGYLRGLAVQDIGIADRYPLPIFVSSGDRYVTIFKSHALTDGAQLLTRASLEVATELVEPAESASR